MNQSTKYSRNKIWIHRVPRYMVDMTLKYPVTALVVIIVTLSLSVWLASMTHVAIYKSYTGVISGIEDNRVNIEAKGDGPIDLKNKECVVYSKADNVRYACEFEKAEKSMLYFTATNNYSELKDLKGSQVVVDVRVNEISLLKKLVRL